MALQVRLPATQPKKLQRQAVRARSERGQREVIRVLYGVREILYGSRGIPAGVVGSHNFPATASQHAARDSVGAQNLVPWAFDSWSWKYGVLPYDSIGEVQRDVGVGLRVLVPVIGLGYSKRAQVHMSEG